MEEAEGLRSKPGVTEDHACLRAPPGLSSGYPGQVVFQSFYGPGVLPCFHSSSFWMRVPQALLCLPHHCMLVGRGQMTCPLFSSNVFRLRRSVLELHETMPEVPHLHLYLI